MKWIKMPKNLTDMQVSLRYVGIIYELAYFAGSKDGKICSLKSSICSKYSITRYALDKLFNDLISAGLIYQKPGKPEYYWDFSWDDKHDSSSHSAGIEHDMNNGLARTETTLTQTSTALTIDRKKERKKEKIYSREESRPCEADKGLVKKEISDIVNYLNRTADKKYKKNTASTIRHIKARLNEGFHFDDFKKVIDQKTEEWKYNEKMNKFLRPETLFGNKFEGYLNDNVDAKEKAKKEADEEFQKLLGKSEGTDEDAAWYMNSHMTR